MAVNPRMEISVILETASHRPYPIPKTQWLFYQEWHDTLFLHWEIPVSAIRPLVPAGLDIDVIDGKTYVSIVAFTVKKGRLFCTPSFPPISNFHEVNVRVYVTNNGKPGIYFLSVEASKAMSAYILRMITGVPYEFAQISRDELEFQCVNQKRSFKFGAKFDLGAAMHKNELDRWLTERYALYVDSGKNLNRFDIHHIEWPVQNIVMHQLITDYTFQTFDLKRNPDIVHYSTGVQVVAWAKQQLP